MSHSPHKNLLTYRYSMLIFDLNSKFLKRFLSEIEHRRTREQMTQAARSGKQNIVEGTGRDLTSMKSEVTLLDVARMSLEELIEDYEDFLRERDLEIWSKTDSRLEKIKKRSYELTNFSNLDDRGEFKVKPKLPENAETAANILLTLCHQATFLLFRQLKAVENKIITEGGYTETLTRKRKEFLNKNRPT